MNKYLLSSGESTYREELYILDQFKLYLTIHPGDIPGVPLLGFDFTLKNVFKSDLKSEVYNRVTNLISKVKDRNGSGTSIEIVSLEIVSEDKANLVLKITAGGTVTDDIDLTLYKN